MALLLRKFRNSKKSDRRRVASKGRHSWSLSALEKRLMLAADCGVAVANAVSESGPVEVGSTDIQSQPTSQIVFIDAGVDAIDQLVDGLAANHEFVLLQADRNGLDQITETLDGRTNVASVHIIAHGQAGELQLGNGRVDLETIQRNKANLQSWSDSLTTDADILIYGCDTGADAMGTQFISALAKLTGADVAASTDKTGSASMNADWDLESHVGIIDAALAINANTRDTYQATLPITIRAAGSMGDEQMLLQIDETTVATFDNVSTDSQDYTFDIDGIDADQVRVVFTNDIYDPANGLDRNLIVDNITIDGATYETEAPEVFSTGTWKAADGIVAGFRESEWLHTDGYFQFAGSTVDPTGDPSGLVINEIHYNPGPDGVVDGDAEFLELYNSGDEAVDLGGLSFTGFDLTFAAGTVIGAGQYAIVAPSIALAESTWGVTPIAEFAGGGLSGGGELIQLLGADGVTVIDEVSYLDESPWSPQPDGNGPSLELRDWALDNSVATNWDPSGGDPTPAAQNSNFGTDPVEPITDIVVTPGTILPGEDFTVTATIDGATTATLFYKVMFGEEQSVTMTNSNGNDWEATLPGEDAGTLIRYRIESDVAVAPFNDSINYLGVVVSPTDIVDNDLPVFQFFVDGADFTQLTTTEQALTNDRIEAVVYYNGEVFDNSTVRVRGGDWSRTFFPKKSLKFELPSGYAMDIGGEGNYLVDEFGINADFGDWSVVIPDISWDVFNAETESFTSSFFVRAEINGDFHGVFRFQELYDGAWRDANEISDDDEFFKADGGGFGQSANFDKKSPDDGDFTNIDELNEVLTAPPSAEKTAYLYQNVDIPNVINHMAISTLMRHDDQSGQNFYVLRNADTGLWSVVEWDVDRTWRKNADDPDQAFTTPESIGAEMLDSVYEVPEFQEMYWRRIQTLVDTYLTDDSLVNRFGELVNEIGATNSALDFERWERNDIFANSFWADEFVEAIDIRRADFANEIRMPGSASGNDDIVINELHYNPADDDAEFLELYNRSTTESVDLSGWTIDGTGLKIAYGTVILPGEYVVLSDNLTQFHEQYTSNVLATQQYPGGLSGGGELITLANAAGNVIDTVEYDDADGWPTEPDGDGFTLALIDPSLDNSLASSWTASSQINGTPGAANGFQGTTNSIKVFAAGSLGTEIVTLEVAGEVVATFDLSASGGQAGDLANRNFAELTWETDSVVNAGDVRINFTNDFYDPAAGIDSNVAIDRIEIDGVSYETEDPSVFSTGTYLPADGVSPGFRLNEVLHANGYFQYGEATASPISDGNIVQIRNFFFDTWLAGIGDNVRTSDTNNLETQWELTEATSGDFKIRNIATGRYLNGNAVGIDSTIDVDSDGNEWQFIEFATGQHYLFNTAFQDYLDANGLNSGVNYDPGPLDPDDRWIISLA